MTIFTKTTLTPHFILFEMNIPLNNDFILLTVRFLIGLSNLKLWGKKVLKMYGMKSVAIFAHTEDFTLVALHFCGIGWSMHTMGTYINGNFGFHAQCIYLCLALTLSELHKANITYKEKQRSGKEAEVMLTLFSDVDKLKQLYEKGR